MIPVSRKLELAALLVTDAVAVFFGTLLYYAARFRWEWLGEAAQQPVWPVASAAVLTGFWLLVLFFFGLYQERYAASRFDELISLLKAVTVGILLLFLLVWVDANYEERGRENILFYWLDIFLMVGVGRIVIRSIQKGLILRGYGTHKALIVGWSDSVERLYHDVARYPEAGLNVVGAIRMRRDADAGAWATPSGGFEMPSAGDGADALVLEKTLPAVSTIEALPNLIDELGVQDVLIALGSDDHRELLEVLRLCDGKSVSLKLVPDFYSVIGGMSRTEHIYGLPLIEVLPEPMPPWERSTKRLIDLFVSLTILIAGLPAWAAIGLLIRMTSPGPAIFRQQRVGRQGQLFTMYKFRTMRLDAEAATGPVWARENDPRYTRVGRFLRKSRLDEIPQFWNVLRNDMSLVGPRPERPFFVEKLSREIPLYNRRHRVKPGITGWAQVKWKYDESLEDVRQKVKYDLFYIENVSLRMDLKILFRTLRTTFLGTGR